MTIEIRSSKEGVIEQYFIHESISGMSFVAGYVKMTKDEGLSFTALVRARPLILHLKKNEKQEYEVGIYQKLVTALPKDVSRIVFLVSNLPEPNKFYTTISEVKKARVNDEKYLLSLSNTLPVTPAEPKSIEKSKERVAIQKQLKARVKGARRNEQFKIKKQRLDGFLPEDARARGEDKE